MPPFTDWLDKIEQRLASEIADTRRSGTGAACKSRKLSPPTPRLA
jgi:hypothetical protein